MRQCESPITVTVTNHDPGPQLVKQLNSNIMMIGHVFDDSFGKAKNKTFHHVIHGVLSPGTAKPCPIFR